MNPGQLRLVSLQVSVMVLCTIAGTSRSFAVAPDKSGVKSSAISLPSGPGSIEGLGESFEPQLNTGSSTYGVAIKLPPGRAGLVPKVRLSYNSGQGNSIVGLGWSFDLPGVKRQADKGFPNYSGADTFIFQGEELVPLQDGTWRCENESGFQRLRQIDVDGDFVPDAWEITDKNGTRHIYGSSRGTSGRWGVVSHPQPPASATTEFDKTYLWALETTIDVHGNRIDYFYTPGVGVLYPSRITYSELNGSFHEVRFRYEGRSDIFDDCRATFPARIDQRLTAIEVYSLGSLVRAYQIRYQQNNAASNLDLSLLESVTQYDANGIPENGGGNYLPPLRFTYSTLNLNAPSLNSLSSRPALDLADQSGNVQIVDLDGDGLPDIFSTQLQGGVVGQQVCLNRGVFGSPTPALQFSAAQQVSTTPVINLSQPETTLTDFDGDGLADYVVIGNQSIGKEIRVYRNVARLDRAPGTLGFDTANPEVQAVTNVDPAVVSFSSSWVRQMDVNFDKRSDFVMITNAFASLRMDVVYRDEDLWKQRSFDMPADWVGVTSSATFDNGGQSNPAVQLADMNGDRLLDLVYLKVSGSFVPTLTVYYWPCTGLGQWGERRTMALSGDDTFALDNVDPKDLFVQDITGDGLADVVLIDGSGSQSKLILRANVAGRKWSAPFQRNNLPRYTPRDPTNPTTLRFADVNGNGSTDLIFRNTGFDGAWQWLDLMPVNKPNLLIGIDNGLGKVTEIVYGSSTDDLIRSRNSGFPWQTRCPFPNQIVRQIKSTDSISGDQYVSDFRYRDAYYDGFEREFRGFAFAERLDLGDDNGAGGLGAAGTPTGQVSGPTLITRYRFLTGAADEIDNDDYGAAGGNNPRTDEVTPKGGREEEILKGRQVWEEKVDPGVLFLGAPSFDQGCFEALTSPNASARLRITPDAYVYTRVRQEWSIRRLYRPKDEPLASSPGGRFATGVRDGSGRSVSFAFVSKVETETFEANGLLQGALGHPVRDGVVERKTVDCDDYGNQVLESDQGIVGGGFDDERVTITRYALGGQALNLWIIDKPLEVSATDEAGKFVSRTNFYYDGAPFVGGSTIESRGLLHRVTKSTDGSDVINTQRTSYDAYGNADKQMDPRGFLRTIGYDAQLKTFPASETIQIGNGKSDLSMSATYDVGFGVITSSTDFNSNSTTYRYDSFGRLVKVIKPGDTLAEPTLEYAYQMVDPVRSQIYTYDTGGGLALSNSAGATVSSRITTRQRNQSGVYTSATYVDGFSRTIAEVGNGDTADSWVVSKLTAYNKRQKPKWETTPFLAAGGSSVPQYSSLVAEDKARFDRTYDPLGREIITVNPAEKSDNPKRTKNTTQFLPFEKRLFDENDSDPGSPFYGTPMVQREDGLGRLVEVREVVKLTDAGEPGALTEWVTSYGYDLNDKLSQIRDSQGNEKEMVYDGLGRMKSMRDPDRGSMTYLYDDSSNITETSDAKEQHIKYTYDGANRLLTEDYLDDDSAEFSYGRSPDVTYTYDDPQRSVDTGDGSSLAPENTKGYLAKVDDASGGEWFSYDPRGRVLTSVKQIRDPLNGVLVPYRTGYTYDSADQIETVLYPDDDQVSMFYNTRNLLRRITGPVSGDLIASTSYKPSGQQASIAYGNGVQTSYDYDPRLRLSSLITKRATLGDSLINYSYTFDGASNITRIEDNRSIPQGDPHQNTQVFAYDDLYRLTQAQYPSAYSGISGGINYRYDRIGNMLSMTSDIPHEEKGRSVTNLGGMSYGAAKGSTARIDGIAPGPHALTSASNGAQRDRRYDYDPNGNTTLIDGLVCTWDFKDRLVRVDGHDFRAEYTYDYSDRRVAKCLNSKVGATEPSITQYVSRYYEVREYDKPIKYIWNGSKREAQIIGSLSSEQRVQRIRFYKGWNLVSVCVSTTGDRILADQAIKSVVVWDSAEKRYLPVGPATALNAGAILWVQASANLVLALRGPYMGSSNLTVPASGGYFANSGFDEISLTGETTLEVWSFDLRLHDWAPRLIGANIRLGTDPKVLAPGRPLFLKTTAPRTISPESAASRIRYYHQDHLGSSSVITRSDGQVMRAESRYPFGHLRNNAPEGATHEPYGFVQKETDTETGLQYFEARYLDDLSGRFVSVDVLALLPEELDIEHPQRLNTYSYATDNPVVRVDPSGETDFHVMWEGAKLMGGGLTGAVTTTLSIAKNPSNALKLSGQIATAGLGFAEITTGVFSKPGQVDPKKFSEAASVAKAATDPAKLADRLATSAAKNSQKSKGPLAQHSRAIQTTAALASGAIKVGKAFKDLGSIKPQDMQTLGGQLKAAKATYDAAKATVETTKQVVDINPPNDRPLEGKSR